METYIHKKFYTNIKSFTNKNLLNSVTVAISGGQDSFCLVKLVQDFKKYCQPSLKINYVYIDHQWQKNCRSHLEHLLNFINSIQERIYIYQIKSISKSEKNARKLRYQILIEHSMSLNSNIIITAHTETDKIETFWLQLIRGTTINGITSLASKRILDNQVQLWRPLINFSRSEIYWFCRIFCLPIWSDSTNYYYNINRNRLRNELIPYLKNYFQSNLDKQIDKFMYTTYIDNEYIKQNTLKLYLLSRHPQNIAINYSVIKKQHLALQARILQLFIYHNVNQLLSQEILYKLIKKIQITLTNQVILKWKNINITLCKCWLYIH